MKTIIFALVGIFGAVLCANAQVDINTNLLGFGSGTSPDTGVSRDSAGVLDIGNGTSANKSGGLNLLNITATGTIQAATLNATTQINVNSVQIASTNLLDGTSLASLTGTQNLTNKTLGSFFLMVGSTSGTATIQTAPVAGTPTLTWPTTSGTILNSAMASCQILDTAICTTAVDSNGNPNFLNVSSTSIQILGGTTPVSYFVAGVYQQINSTLTITNCGTQPCYSTPAGETEFFIFVKQDTSNANPVAADLVITNCVPLVSYTAPSGCSGVSTTNPQYWFNLSTNQMMACTGSCGTSTNFTVQNSILLGVAAISHTPSVDAVLAMPYRLNPYEQFKQFSDGSGGPLALTTGTTAEDGEFHYSSCLLSSATLSHSNPSNTLNTPGLLISCQTPMLVVGTGSINVSGNARVGGTGGISTCSAVASASGFGGGGGGSGSASTGTSFGCAGGSHAAFCCSATTSVGAGAGGATAGASGSAGGNSNAGWAGSGGLSPMSSRDLMPYAWGMGAPGAVGAGGGSGHGSGGNGGSGGGVAVVKVPSLYVGASASINCNGTAGGNGTSTGGAPTGGGGGGGGGGTCGYITVFSENGTTGITANGASGGTGGTSAGNGGSGGNGNIVAVKLW